jgi:formylglycine-generating enzyme required for sulfatase activity
MKTVLFILSFVILWLPLGLFANNIQINNISLTGTNPAQGFTLVEFDINWQNSWRSSSAPGNWDAAWVFIKYRKTGGEWKHARLNDTGHNTGTGTPATLEVGLRDPKLTFNITSNPGIGATVYRSQNGIGEFAITNMQLRWNYESQSVSLGDSIEVRVFAIEMVMVPGGNYVLGDGSSVGRFRQVAVNAPYQVSTSGSPIKCESGGSDDTQLRGTGIWLDGDLGISRTASTETNMNTDFPTGFRGFYCMKYEISQGQYRDFLNTLTRQQQNARTATNISGTSISNRYVMSNSSGILNRNGLRCNAALPSTGPVEIYCDLDGDGIGNEPNDGEWIACNFIGFRDGAAFLDWCGLRYMTELEYEKAARGPGSAIAGEYAWGTATVANSPYSTSNSGLANEGIGSNYNSSSGNAIYSATKGGINGPLRVGIFSANAQNTGRLTSGASYYGIMELSGNLWERIVGLSNSTSRNYNAAHGDGEITADGEANVSNGLGSDGSGSGVKGGSYDDLTLPVLRTSDRLFSGYNDSGRLNIYSIRGARSISSSGGGY